MDHIYLSLVLAPLFGAVLAGLWRNQLGRSGSHWVTILGVAISCGLSLYVLSQFITGQTTTYNESVYTWMQIGGLKLEVGFLVDTLTAMMISVVTFVSLMVHIYTVGYMHDEDGYQRFFSYISLFTFSMLMLVMANNFMQLFFGLGSGGLGFLFTYWLLF
jgi:NADH-quinone oxidoreductase subunit L